MFGQTILKILKDRGLDQQFLSDKTGKDPSHIHKILHKTERPQRKTVKEIGDALELEFEQMPDGSWIYKDVNTPANDDIHKLRADNLPLEITFHRIGELHYRYLEIMDRRDYTAEQIEREIALIKSRLLQILNELTDG